MELFDNPASYQAMSQARNPYGDGQASQRIVEILDHQLATPERGGLDSELFSGA
jgi:UDP-N-acetylglucosamine 2-epimerase (non-hydrolysing)